MEGFLRGLVVVVLGFCGVGAFGQDTLFSDDFNRTGLGANLDSGWVEAIVTAGDDRFWQISPMEDSFDLRISDQDMLTYSADGATTTTKVVYQIIDASVGDGYNNLTISFSYSTENDITAEGNSGFPNFTPGNFHDDNATVVYSINSGGAWNIIGGPYENSSATVTDLDIGAGDGVVIWIGFQLESNDANGDLDVDNDDDFTNVNRFIIDDVVIKGTAIVPPTPDVGNWYLTADGLDPTVITNWISDDEEAGAVTSSFTDLLNTFNVEVGTFLLGILQAPTPAIVDMGANWSVANVVVPAGSKLRNNSVTGYNLTLTGTIDMAGEYEHYSKDNGGKTTDFPFDKLVGDELTGTLTMFSDASFANAWDLTQSLDWSASGIIVNNGEWEISGGSSFQLDVSEISSVNVNAFVKVTEDATFMKINEAISLPAGIVDFFQSDNSSWTSRFKLGDITLTGEINIDANMAFSIEGTTMTLADNAVVNWHSKDGIDFVNPFSIVEETPGGGSGFALVENMILESGDDLDVLIPISLEGGSETITLEAGSKLVLRSGTINDITVEGTSEFRIVTPQAGTLQHDDVVIEAGGLMICENGSDLIQLGVSKIYIQAGDTAFSQGGSFVDLDATGTSYSAAPTVVASNHIGYTEYSHYTYWSSPVAGIPVWSIPQTISVYEYTDKLEGDSGWVAASGNFAVGRGYALQQAGGDVISFEGVVNSGDLTGVPEAGDDIPLDNSDENWTLVGNPYPSPINGLTFINGNPGTITTPTVSGAIYLWDQSYNSSTFSFTTSDYTTVNGTGVAGGDFSRYSPGFDLSNLWIAPFQGFIIGAENDSFEGEVIFNNSMRDPATQAVDYEWTFKSVQPKKMWLSLEEWNVSSPKHTETLIGFLDGASSEWDRVYDARPNKGSFAIGSLVYQNNSSGNASKGHEAVIQGLPEFTGDEVIDLVLGIDVPGAYELDIMKHINFENQEVWIHDPTIDVDHLLSQQPFIFQVNEAGEYPIQLMFREPGVIGITEKVVPRALEFKRTGDLWKSNVDGSYSVFNLAGQIMEKGVAKANRPFEIKSNQGFVSFVSEDGQHEKYLLR